MDVCGIIAEYNPFHNGHAHHISMAKREFGQVIVAMSGAFVQRGEAAAFDKWMRTRWALLAGADVVVELPQVFVQQSAQYFAEGGVRLLSSAGCDCLSFGSEDVDSKLLSAAARSIAFLDCFSRDEIRRSLKTGASYARSINEVAEKESFEVASAMRRPNFLLGAHYLAAIDRWAPQMQYFPIKRIGCEYNDAETLGEYSSASAIRRALACSLVRDVQRSVPSYVAEDLLKYSPIDKEAIDTMLMYAIRTSNASELKKISGMSEGLENAVMKSKNAPSIDTILMGVKSKRYTLARLRRLLCHVLLNMDTEIVEFSQSMEIKYARVLGWRTESIDLLRLISKNGLKLIINRADLNGLSREHSRIFEIDRMASDIQSLAFDDDYRRKGGRDFLSKPIVV